MINEKGINEALAIGLKPRIAENTVSIQISVHTNF